MSLVRVGRWMGEVEYDAMVATGQVQPTLDGRDMKHVTSPPAPDDFRAANPGSMFVEFDVDDAQMLPGGREGWFILYGPNSVHGRNAARKGLTVTELSAAQNIVVMEIKKS